MLARLGRFVYRLLQIVKFVLDLLHASILLSLFLQKVLAFGICRLTDIDSVTEVVLFKLLPYVEGFCKQFIAVVEGASHRHRLQVIQDKFVYKGVLVGHLSEVLGRNAHTVGDVGAWLHFLFQFYFFQFDFRLWFFIVVS